MDVTKALFVRLEAKPGKEADVAEFLRGALPVVEGGDKTVTWFALQFGPGTFGIYDASPTRRAGRPTCPAGSRRR